MLLDYGYMLFKLDNQKLCKVNLYSRKGSPNYSIYSIALSCPSLTKLQNIKQMPRLDFFCPTYDMLVRYKKDQDWKSYTSDYHKLLKKRRTELKEWLESLNPDHVYLLCCWEDTSFGAHCHREILWKVLSKSETAKRKVIAVYRHGDKIYKEKEEGPLASRRHPVGYLHPETTNIGAWNLVEFLDTVTINSTTSPDITYQSDNNQMVAINDEGQIVHLPEFRFFEDDDAVDYDPDS